MGPLQGILPFEKFVRIYLELGIPHSPYLLHIAVLSNKTQTPNTMKDVKIKEKGGNLFVIIRIQGLVGWKFSFSTTDIEKPFTEKSSKTTKDTFRYDLGPATDLFLDNNNWGFVLVNIDDDDQDYIVSIEWEQDEKVVDTWTANGSLSASEVKEIFSDARIIF